MAHLGEFEQLVMLAVMRLGEEAYGAGIQRELERRAKRRVSIGTIYVTLMRLEGKGLVASWFAEPTAERGGKAKRVFRVEGAGLRALRASRDALLGMWEGLDSRGRGEEPGYAK